MSAEVPAGDTIELGPDAPRSGRIVYVAQWYAPVAIMLWMLFGRSAVGSPFGWFALLGIMLMGPIALLLYAPAIITRADLDVRRTRATRRGYTVAAFILWTLSLIAGVVLSDGADAPPYGSALTMWTGGAVSPAVSASMLGGVALAALAVYFAMLVLAILGVARSVRPLKPAMPRPVVLAVAVWLWWLAIAVEAVLIGFGLQQLVMYGISALLFVGVWLLLAFALVVGGGMLVPQLGVGRRSARTPLTVIAGVVVVGTAGLDAAAGGIPGYDLLVIGVLVAATILTFLPAVRPYFDASAEPGMTVDSGTEPDPGTTAEPDSAAPSPDAAAP